MNKQIQEAVDRLNGLKGVSARDKLNAFVDEAAALTGSKLSYFAVLNEAGDKLTMLGWSRSAMEACSMLDKPLDYPLEQTGVWGDCIREGKPVIINDYAGCTKKTKKGYPDGHVHVIRHANLPIREGSRMVGLIGVGNKETDYDEEDMEVLSTFAQKAWPFVKKEIVDEMSV
jgi:GAF domain-containing protein